MNLSSSTCIHFTHVNIRNDSFYLKTITIFYPYPFYTMKKIDIYYVEKSHKTKSLIYTYLCSTNIHRNCKSAKESMKRSAWKDYPQENIRAYFAK